MNRRFLVLAALSLPTLAGAFACSGAPSTAPDTSTESPAPAGSLSPPATPPSAGDDAGSPADAGADAALPAAPAPGPVASQPPAADAAPPPATGTLLVGGSSLELFGVTDDGFMIYGGSSQIHAAPLAGGAGVVVADEVPGTSVTISGSVAFVRTMGALGHSTLSAWTHAHGTVLLDSSSPTTAPVVASADGARAAFLTGEPLVQLKILGTDGTSPVALGAACATALAFEANGDLVSTNCPAAVVEEDAAALSPSLSIFAAPSYASSRVETDGTYAFDPSGAWLWTIGDDGAGRLLRVSDGAILFTDASASGAALFDSSSTALYYVSGNTLRSVSLASPSAAPAVLASEVSSLVALSPDGTSVAYTNGIGAFAIPTGGAGATVRLSGAEQGATFTYTSDSKAVVVITPGNAASGYEIRSAQQLESLARGEASSVTVLAGSNVLVVDPSNEGHVIDVAAPGTDLELPGMGAFAVSKDLTEVAYVAGAVAAPGLYVVNVQASQAGSAAP